MSMIKVSTAHIEQAMQDIATPCFSALDDAHWHGMEQGVDCLGYSADEREAMDITRDFAAAMGAVSYQDESGVRYHVFRGGGGLRFVDGVNVAEETDKPAIMILSHLDAVPNGGRYDGRAGVVAGLAAAFAGAAHHQAQGTKLDRPLVVAEFPCEESPEFGCFALGSKIATRQITPDFIISTKGASDNRSIFHRMNDIGLDAAKVCENLTIGNKTLPVDHIGAAYEYHIAQSGGMVNDGLLLAPCKDVRGNVRPKTEITFRGEGGHSGAVDMKDRKSASKAARLFMDYMDETCEENRKRGADIVNTDTYISAGDKKTRTTIPDYAECWYEIRSNDDAMLQHLMRLMVNTAKRVRRETGVEINLADQGKDMLALNQAAQLDEALAQQFSDLSAARGVAASVRSSGAGHDAMILAQQNVPATIILGAHGNNGISHDPAEILGSTSSANPFAAGEAFYEAVAVLSDVVLNGPATTRDKTPDGKSFEQVLIERGARPV